MPRKTLICFKNKRGIILALIDKTGTLQLKAEDETESFAMKQWWENWGALEDVERFEFTMGDDPDWLMIENDAGNDDGCTTCVLVDIDPINKTEWLDPEYGKESEE